MERHYVYFTDLTVGSTQKVPICRQFRTWVASSEFTNSSAEWAELGVPICRMGLTSLNLQSGRPFCRLGPVSTLGPTYTWYSCRTTAQLYSTQRIFPKNSVMSASFCNIRVTLHYPLPRMFTSQSWFLVLSRGNVTWFFCAGWQPR